MTCEAELRITGAGWPTRRNVLSNTHVGLVFLIPGRGDTLRINGRATLVRDGPFFKELVVSGHRPVLALVVNVEQVFFHCPKAFMRARLWDVDSWRPEAVPSRAHIEQRLERPEESLAALEAYCGPVYAEKLYVESAPRGLPGVQHTNDAGELHEQQ